MLKVCGGFDPVTADHVIGFRVERTSDGAPDRGVVDADGRIQYQPPSVENLRPTLRLTRDEAEALAKHLQDYGYTPKPSEVETPLKAHLADAMAIRDRLLLIVERKQ